MQPVLKPLLQASLLASFLFLSACDFVDAIFAPCENCSYSSGGGSYDGGSYDNGSSNDSWGGGSYDSDRRSSNPPRYQESDNSRRNERDARAREMERGHRPPSKLYSATLKLMQKYSLREESAEALALRLLEIKAGHTHSLKELGMTQQDLELMARGHNPSAKVLRQMSEVLKMDLGEVHTLIQQIKADLVARGVI